MAFGFKFSLNYIKWIEIISHAVILVYKQLELPTIIIKIIDFYSNSDQLYFSRQTKVFSCAQDPNGRSQKHWLGQESPRLCKQLAYSSLFCTILLPNSWYCTVRFANFKGILGFSVLSIILADLPVLFLRQNPFKVFTTAVLDKDGICYDSCEWWHSLCTNMGDQRTPSRHLKEMSGDQFGEFACGYWA